MWEDSTSIKGNTEELEHEDVGVIHLVQRSTQLRPNVNMAVSISVP